MKGLFILFSLYSLSLCAQSTVFNQIVKEDSVNYFEKRIDYSRIKTDSTAFVMNNKYTKKNQSFSNIYNVNSLWFQFNDKRRIKISKGFNELDKLENLIITGNSNKTKLYFKSQSGLENLTNFVSQNIVFDSIPEFLYNSKNIESISIYTNGEFPVNFSKLASLKKLKRLELINVSDKKVTMWSDKIYDLNLEYLILYHNTPVNLDTLKLKNMKTLNCLSLNTKSEDQKKYLEMNYCK